MEQQVNTDTVATPNPTVNQNNSPDTIFSDNHTVELLRDFLASEKPDGTTPLDILQIVYLALRKAGDHDIFDSQQTLADRLGVDIKTIKRSQERLASPRYNWIARPQREGRTNALSLKVDNLPLHETHKVFISQDARSLAALYREILETDFKRNVRQKHWYTRQLPSAQNILNACNGNLQLARWIMKMALRDSDLQKRAKKSMYHLFGIWDKAKDLWDRAEAEYNAQHLKDAEPKTNGETE